MNKKHNKSEKNPQNKKIKIIRVAILAEEPLGWGSGKHYFPVILNEYSWKTKTGTTYKFSATYIYDKDILQGKLNVSNFDVLLVPGGGVGDGEAVAKGFNHMRKVKRWKYQICKFIKEGGGYLGICGGVALVTGLTTESDKKPKTFLEKRYDKSSLNITCATSYYKDLAFPLFYLFQYKNPEKIGAMAYVFSFAPGQTVDGTKIYTGGVPIDFKILNSNSIFSDYPSKTVRIRWWGGPALLIPEKPDREIKVVAQYPRMELSENTTQKIYAWRYTGGLIGLLKAFLKALSMVKQENEGLKNVLMYTYFMAGPWKPTNRLIELNFSNKACMTTEIYPNENKGRIFLCTAHPEYMVWSGGHIEEVEYNGDNCLATGLHRWKDINLISETVNDSLTHTWWVVRRITAWTAKVPDKDLPPIEKGKINQQVEPIIKNNIYWDGTLINQIKNI